LSVFYYSSGPRSGLLAIRPAETGQALIVGPNFGAHEDLKFFVATDLLTPQFSNDDLLGQEQILVCRQIRQ
jgi:hypothetical protein